MYKAVAGHVKVKMLLSRRRQSDYSVSLWSNLEITVSYGTLPNEGCCLRIVHLLLWGQTQFLILNMCFYVQTVQFLFKLQDLQGMTLPNCSFSFHYGPYLQTTYNHGKNVDTFYLISEKKWPPFSQFNVDQSHVVRSQCLIPQHWHGGREGLLKEQEPLLSFKQCHVSFSILVINIKIVVINCIRCANYFFQWLYLFVVFPIFQPPTHVKIVHVNTCVCCQQVLRVIAVLVVQDISLPMMAIHARVSQMWSVFPWNPDKVRKNKFSDFKNILF